MMTKGIIGILLLLGTLEVLAKSDHDRSDVFPKKGVNYFESHKKGFRESQITAALQFQQDYKNWGDEKYAKHDIKERKDNINHLRFNEIPSGEYDDKHEKLGDSVNLNNFNKQNEKSHHEERKHEKLSLVHDLDVNYNNDNKKISGDSEPFLNIKTEETYPEVSLVHDIDVNYNDNKKISGDSEMISNKPVIKSKEKYEENYQNGNDFYMKRTKKDIYQNLIKIDLTNPPPPNDTVLMARYIVHNVDWAALGTLSARSPTKGSPFVCVKATSDGMRNESSGIPFFYMSSMDLCTQDLEKDNRVSVLVTLSQTEYCKDQNFDPQDPRCAKLTLSGKIKKIKSGSDEEKFAKAALFTRHPAMKSWPKGHHFYFTKLKIGQIVLLDHFGGATYIKVKDYLNGKVVEPELKKK